MSKAARKAKQRAAPPTSLEYFSHLKWIDGRPLLDVIEPYRQQIFRQALDTYRPDGVPVHNMVLAGRGKKNGKSLDLVLAALYCLDIRESVHGNDCFILANDEDQAGDDLELAKKLVAINPDLSDVLDVLQKEIRRRDGKGALQILPARDAIGAHGKTSLFVGFDEIHGYRTYDLLEALAPDPTRADALTWITSYDTIFNTPGIPLFDFKAIGKAGSDPRMVFSWYSGDYCSDPAFISSRSFAPIRRSHRGRRAGRTSTSSGADFRHTSSAGCISICRARRTALSLIRVRCSTRSSPAARRCRLKPASSMSGLSICPAGRLMTRSFRSPIGMTAARWSTWSPSRMERHLSIRAAQLPNLSGS